MHSTLVDICTALDNLADSILKGDTDERTMTEIWGWNCPPLSRHDLANMATMLSAKIKENNLEQIDERILNIIKEIPQRVEMFKARSIQYLFNGNSATAYPIYMALIEWITITIQPIFNWQVLQDNKALPNQLANRLRSIQAGLNDIVPEKNSLEKQIKLINDATIAAESLPTDLESLKDARQKVNKFSSDAAELYGKIDTYFKESDKISITIQEKKKEADRLVQQCEEAYRITTTKGLAAAFDQRANRLSTSLWIWVAGLLLALIFGSLIGAHRVTLLSKLATSANPNWSIIWMHIILSILSIGAPLWFAWLATKQISQRFRLSEDYAFKASVAKAYEGYRKEAARIDVAFEARLFSSALTRLEEAPLRLMEQDTYGSPWHELISSPQFLKAIATIPELKDKFIEITKTGVEAAKLTKSNVGKIITEETDETIGQN